MAIEDRPQHHVGPNLGVKAVHQALDHRLGNARPLHDLGRDPRAPLRLPVKIASMSLALK